MIIVMLKLTLRSLDDVIFCDEYASLYVQFLWKNIERSASISNTSLIVLRSNGEVCHSLVCTDE